MAHGADHRMTADASSPIQQPSRPIALAMAVAFVAYLLLLHALIVSGAWPRLTLALVFLPWVVALLTSAAQASTKPLRRTFATGIAGVLAWMVWRYGDDFASRADLMLYLENLVFFLVLSTLFAVSLRPGRDALITRLARVARNGDMPPPVVRYTRLVTIGWAAFFAIASLVSSLLFFTQSRTVWSAFVNLAIWPLVAAGFALEYAIRLRVLREFKHVSMMTGVQAFRQRAAIDARGES